MPRDRAVLGMMDEAPSGGSQTEESSGRSRVGVSKLADIDKSEN
jgi:hypothetical protein